MSAFIAARSAHLSVVEFFDRYPPKLYVISWLPRAIFQLAFFAILAGFLGGPGYQDFVVTGTVMHATYIGVTVLLVSFVGMDLSAGTIPLLVAAPSHPLVVLVARNAALVANSVFTGLVTLALAAVMLRFNMTVGEMILALGVLVLAAVSAACFGLLVGSIGLRFPDYRNTMSNLSVIVLTFFAGTYVPTDLFPAPLRVLGEFLPVTNALRILRHLTLDVPLDVGGAVLAEIAIASGLLGLALVSFAYFLRSARTHGTLDFH